MNDEHAVDPRFIKFFNTGYYLEKADRFQDIMKEQKNPKFLETVTYKALDAGRIQAKKDKFLDNFNSKDKDRDRDR